MTDTLTLGEGTVLLSRSDGIATITLDRPEVLNSINHLMWHGLLEAFRTVADDPSDRCVVIRGSGPAFCSGADLTDAAEGRGAAGVGRSSIDNMRKIAEVCLALHELPKPVVSAVHGVAAGAGCNLALAADIIVAGPDARFCQIFARRGLSIDFGGSWLLPRLVGLHKAKELTLLGEMIDAPEAYRIGLVNRLTDADGFDAEVDAVAARLGGGPPIALAASKRLLTGCGKSKFGLAIRRWIEKTVGMSRGEPERQMAMLSTLSTEDLIPPDHPIRRIRVVVDAVLAELDGDFDAMYSSIGRRSIPPESLLKATVLMAMYSIRSERAFCERLNYDMLFKWFLDMPIDAKAFDPTTFTKNRTRLLDAEIADRFFEAVVRQAKLRRYMSSEHFSVDGTLLEAWASHKSFKPKDRPGDGDGDVPSGRNSEVDWKGQKRSNVTHESTTDPESRLARKSAGTAAKMCYSGHLLMEHRNALIVDADLVAATGHAERDTAKEMLARLPKTKRRRTVAADKAYDTAAFVADVRELGFTPHVAQNTTNRRSAIDARTTRHAGHKISLRIRARIEEPYGWTKTIAGGRKLRYIGKDRNRAWFKMVTATYNVMRIAALDTATA